MLRIIVLCWIGIAAVGVSLIFPFKEEQMTENLNITKSLNKSEIGSHESINSLDGNKKNLFTLIDTM